MDSIASKWHVVLKDQDGVEVALFDDWDSLHIERRLNDIGSHALNMVDDGDTRFDLFDLDGTIEFWRTVPGCDLDFYREFQTLSRKNERMTGDDGRAVYVSTGVGFNELLARKIIAYKQGTIRADKDAPSETVMKEYVEENLGPTADDTVVGRLFQGGIPGFRVEEDSGKGIDWTGSRAYENVLDVLKEISVYSDIDFSVEPDGDAKFVFMTYEDQMGANRTDEEVDSSGKNKYGYAPIIFDVALGNVRTDHYTDDRLDEANVVVVLGDGEGSTRTTLTVQDYDAIADSPINTREISRSAGDYDRDYETHSLTTFGDEQLEEMQAKETFELVPLQQPATLYGKHYFLGDRVVVQKGTIKEYKKIVAVSIDIDTASSTENIVLEFADIPTLK